MKIILASKSPRRIEILHSHGIDAVTMPTETDESLPAGIGMTDAVEMLAERKAAACYEAVRSNPEYKGFVIIGADTIVWKDEIMGKPSDHDDARRMLTKIRGTVHYVVTGVSLIDVDSGDVRTLSDITRTMTYKPTPGRKAHRFCPSPAQSGWKRKRYPRNRP